MAGIKIADITENVTRDAAIGGALLPMSLNGETFSVEVNDFFYPNVINATRLATNAINANHITSLTVLARHIQGNAITASKIKTGSITSKEISADTIDAIKVSAAQINVNSIVASVISSITITSDKIAVNAITSREIDTDAINANHIQAFSVTSNAIRANAITAGKILAGTITANEIAACTVAAANIASGAVQARALAANIIMTGSLQSRNFDGYEGSLTDNNAILRSLDAGSKGFFLNEKTGAIICTDLIARNNIITSNLINFSLTASSLEEVTGDNGEKSIQVALDDNTLARDPDTGRITISNKLVNTKGLFDKSLLLAPNTIFFGMSERQEFKLPTIGGYRQAFAVYAGEGNGNMNPIQSAYARTADGRTIAQRNPFTVGLSATYFRYPSQANSQDGSTGTYWRRGSYAIGGGTRISSGNQGSFTDSRIVVYHPDDNRIKNLPFLGNEIMRETDVVPMQEDPDLDGFLNPDFWRQSNTNSIAGEPVLFALDLFNYVESPDQISSDIMLNNYKIKVDVSKFDHINDIIDFKYHNIKSFFCVSTADGGNEYSGTSFGLHTTNRVNNPIILPDIYEYSGNIDLGRVKKENSTRYLICHFNGSHVKYKENYMYPGYVPVSAVFDTDTNLRFEVSGVVPSTKRYDLSTINCLVPQNYHPDNKDGPYGNPTQQKLMVSKSPELRQAKRMLWEHDWYSDEPAMEGFPEIDPNRVNPANGLRGFDSVAATIQHYGAEPGDSAITSIITDRNKPDQNLDRPTGGSSFLSPINNYICHLTQEQIRLHLKMMLLWLILVIK